MAISIYKIEKEKQEKIVADYQNGKSMRQLEKDYGVNRSTISKCLEEKEIKTQKGNQFRKYYHNIDYFENIDDEHKAYWLGFLFADGYIVDNSSHYGEDRFGLSLAEEDKQILELLKKDLQATNPIRTYERNGIKGQPLSRIELTSQKTVNDLIDKGCVKKKSLILSPPKNIPEELIPHFIRGFFDGDGSITKTKNIRYASTGNFCYGVNFTTTKEMADWLQNYFDIGTVRKEPRNEKTYYFTFGGHRQVLSFFHQLYDNATIYLERKYLRFEELSKYIER